MLRKAREKNVGSDEISPPAALGTRNFDVVFKTWYATRVDVYLRLCETGQCSKMRIMQIFRGIVTRRSKCAILPSSRCK